MNTRNLVLVVGLGVGIAFVGGCEEKNNPAPKTTEALKDAAKSGTEAVKDAAKSGTEAVKDAAKTGTEAVKDAAKDVSAWMSDTAEKQWPAAKTELDGYAKKVSEIHDPVTKVKAEGLLKGLQAQVPAVEKAFADLKGASAENTTAMLDNAKKLWDGFAANLAELKKLIPA